ncbi:hypothetical protein CASFOL_025671 [Castilleja foliolosa]|uniref:Homeobox domain-containing protein n=1 Tax=Castilleja foliolosa TaxID=1961234 RepID=A0ABD3CVU1_9LAMI
MDENNDQVRLGLGLDLGLGLNHYNKPEKIDYDSRKSNNKRKSFLDLSIIPLHTSNDHGLYTSDDSSLKIMGKDVMKRASKDEDDDESKLYSCRKKLRLTTDQITLLEDCFKQQTTLNTAQKQALAERLNLKPRQVEVWFQNRRARTKLKQTEVDCEFQKRNCERLSEENWRLKKELLELRSSMKMEKPAPPSGLGQAQPQMFHHNHVAAAAGDEKE